MFKDLLEKRRSIRFYEQKDVEDFKVQEILEAARKSPSSANCQKIRYVVIKKDRQLFEEVFKHTAWGGAVKPKRNPTFGVNSANFFIAVYRENNSSLLDVGASVMSMLYMAAELDLGSCWIGAFNKAEVTKLLNYDENYDLVSLVAIGYPAETSKTVDIELDTPHLYYLDENDNINVPKYTIDSLTDFR